MREGCLPEDYLVKSIENSIVMLVEEGVKMASSQCSIRFPRITKKYLSQPGIEPGASRIKMRATDVDPYTTEKKEEEDRRRTTGGGGGGHHQQNDCGGLCAKSGRITI